MAVRTVDGEKTQIVPENEEKMPLLVKVLGLYASLVNPWVYRKDGTLYRKLHDMLLLSKVSASSKPVNGISTTDVVIDAASDVWVRIFTPSQEEGRSKGKTENDGLGSNSEKKLPVIVYYHGGGFISSSADNIIHDNFCRKIAKSCNAVIVSVNYRLAPEFPYPTAYDDCYKAFGWLQSPDSHRYLPSTADISQCFLFGDSAGGNIVHHMGCRAAESDITPIKLRGMVLMQPFFGKEGDLTPAEINLKKPVLLDVSSTHWMWKAFLPAGANRDHGACNVFGPNSADISGLPLPPILVIIGSLDILQDYQASYVKKLQELGKDVTVLNYAGVFHAFYIFDMKSTATAVADVRDFIRSHALEP